MKDKGIYVLGFIMTFSVIVNGFSDERVQSVSSFKILPQPQEIVWLEGKGLDTGDLTGIRLSGIFKRPVMGRLLTALPLSQSSGEGILTLTLFEDSSLPDSMEGYVLEIRDGKGELTSRGKAGLFYGCQTLEQILEDIRDNQKAFPACRITDFPVLSYRAIHIDVKHHLDTMKYYYDSIDRLTKYKINAVIFEFEDKLRYSRRPLIGAPQSISIDEMAALTRYARDRHIEISPLVQGLGHATYILKHKKYAHLRENPDRRWSFCPCDEGTYELLFDLYLDAIEATPGSRFFHVGGDEVGYLGTCPRCKERGEKEGILALNLYWLKRVSDFVHQHRRIPIFWDDMIFKYAGLWDTMKENQDPDEVSKKWEKGESILDSVLELYPKNCVYMRWNYTLARQHGNIRALDWFKKRGLRVWIATAAQNVHPLLPQDDRLANIHSFIGLAAEKRIPGMLCTAWDDSSPHMETYWRGLIGSAEFSWNPLGRSLEEYGSAYLQREFGPECVEPGKGLYAELFKGVSFWNRAFLADGERRQPRTLIDLPDPTDPGAWSEKWGKHLREAEEEITRYGKLKAKLGSLKNSARRNRYRLELLEAINELQVTPSILLNALKQWDADRSGRKDAEQVIIEALATFERAWKELLAVYEKTRFLTYPENYVKDRYTHMASQKENQSWLIEVDSRFHSLLKTWLNKYQ